MSGGGRALGGLLLLVAGCAGVPGGRVVPLPETPVPEAVRTRFALDPFYQQFLAAAELPIVASSRVDPLALVEARAIVLQMCAERPEILAALAAANVRLAVMAHDEFTTELPEHSDLEPAAYWDVRARGLGATAVRPAVSCGEENLLALAGDPYSTENILVHEFAHAIHQMALDRLDPTFDGRLHAAFARARGAGLWEGTYAATNAEEYWAEATQSWFDTNRADDDQHNHVDTRDELRAYDPPLADLCREVYGERSWRYENPRDRHDPGHFRGFDRAAAPRFAWPEEKRRAFDALEGPPR